MNAGKRITVLDTTLRDGDQAPGFAFSFSDKLRVASMLERLGVDVIEAGFPASSKADFESVRAVSSMVENAAVAVMARAVPSDIITAANAIRCAKRKMIHLSIATSLIHRQSKLNMDRRQIIKTAVDAVYCARQHADIVEIGAEDAVRTEHEFLIEFCSAVTDAGANVVNITDTVGYVQPSEFAHLVRHLITHVDAFASGRAKVSVHCHNDLGLATANTLAGIEAGATQIETTLSGIGERAGNTSLEEILAAFEGRPDYYGFAYTGVNRKLIAESSRLFARITGVPPAPSRPVTGRNAFVHASGIHQDGMLSNPHTYSLFPGDAFGFESFRLTATRHSGTHGIARIIQDLTGRKIDGEKLAILVSSFKDREPGRDSGSATDFIRCLKTQGVYSGPIWELSLFEYSRDGRSNGRFKIKYSTDGGAKKSLEHTAPADIGGFFTILNTLFNLEISVISFSFTAAGSGTESGGRFFLLASANGRRYHCERSGTDCFRLAAETYADIVNAVQCANTPEEL
jgi:2-isopropylmalate synthase